MDRGIKLDGQIEFEALRLFWLPEAAPAMLYACPSVPVGTRNLALETTWDLPSLTAGATADMDVTVPVARRGDFADASFDTSSIAFVLNCHAWSNNSVRVTARNVGASTLASRRRHWKRRSREKLRVSMAAPRRSMSAPP